MSEKAFLKFLFLLQEIRSRQKGRNFQEEMKIADAFNANAHSGFCLRC